MKKALRGDANPGRWL